VSLDIKYIVIYTANSSMVRPKINLLNC